MKYILLSLFAVPLFASGQSPQVPHKLQFAGMTLTIRDDARREIQKDVDMLTRSPRHFNIKVQRAKTYFPIIERVFAEERLPDDFKYLVLQESALIPDAVSVSQAVGFWQFKDFTAVEMGLRVDKDVDERMNIVSSTRAAARYIKKNNFYFNNWLHALQAYQMGAGGAMKAIKDDKAGARHMEITSKTYWYVKKYLAHKIAFEGAVEGPGEVTVALVPSKGHESLKEIARKASMTADELLEYNKWVRRDDIPADKDYAILVPVNNTTKDYLVSIQATTPETFALASNPLPEKKATPLPSEKAATTTINGVPAMAAKPGESALAFAKRAGVRPASFLKYNDIGPKQGLEAGRYYFTERKRARADEDYHKLAEGESLWDVSQQYGIRLNRLLRLNRLDDDTRLAPGTMLYLSSRKPRGDSKISPEDVPEVDRNSLFAWSAEPSREDARVTTVRTEKQPATRQPVSDTYTASKAGADDQESDVNRATVSAPDESAMPGVSVPQSEPVFQESGNEHKVLPGETLYGISRTYNVEVMDLVRWNDLDLNEGIKPGQVLQVQGASEQDTVASASVSPPSEIIHEVRASDTLYSVARKYGVSIKELMEWNQKSDFNIHVGEKLKVLAR